MDSILEKKILKNIYQQGNDNDEDFKKKLEAKIISFKMYNIYPRFKINPMV